MVIRLTLERKSRGWTQAMLQRRSGVHATTLSLIESGRYRPSAAQTEKLRRAFGIRQEDAGRLFEPVEIEPLGIAG